MTSALPIQQIVNKRFNELFVDLKVAVLNVSTEGQKKLDVVAQQQNKTPRRLLRVEKQAIREKDLNEKLELNYINEIRDQIHLVVEQRLQESLKDTDNLYSKVLGIDEKLPELLDLISVRAATISKIEPLATEIPWLYQELLKLVNQPKYRRFNNQGKVVGVENFRAGLSFFGLENLSNVVISLALRRLLPQITDPYPRIKASIWEQAIATGIACKTLARVSNIDQSQAFILGMLHMVGSIVIVRLYFRLFESVQQEALIEAHEGQKHQEHTALMQTEPCGEFLTTLIDKYALQISAQIIDKMALRRVFIANAMNEFAAKIPFQDMSPLTRVLQQGHAYAKYRLLKSQKLLDEQQSREFLLNLNFPSGALAALKTTDIRVLNFTAAN
ncbi:MAG: HD-like signal output (HDOD) protein [Paraglaciecola sp.]|jgi:HD-like signal output (HDOD) protein